MNTSSPIHLALASDDNYFEGLLTTAWSAARNCSRPEQLVIHVLDGGITDAHWQFLAERLAPFGVTLDRLAIDEAKAFANLPTYHGSTRMTFARLLLPDLLPDVDEIIYSDVDILWIVDIAELWDALDPNAIIHCTPSNHSPQAEIEWCEKYGYAFERGTRFCAGLVVFNLAKFRAEGLHRKMLAALEACGGHAPCNDETVLNALTFNRPDRGFLPGRWQHWSAGRADPYESDGFVLHFLMDTPWQSLHKYNHLLTNQRLLWHRFHAEARQISPWRSMRMANGVGDILLCRALFLVAASGKLGQWLIKRLLTLRGKAAGWSIIEAYTRPFILPADFSRKLLP